MSTPGGSGPWRGESLRVRVRTAAIVGPGARYAARRMRSVTAIALLVALALAGCAGGGSNNKDSASDFTGEEKAVATTVEDLQSAAEDSDERKICSDLIVAELRDAIAENGNAATCVAAMEGVLKDTDQSDLTVRRVSIDGTKASAVVRAKLGDDKSRDETVELRKVANRWKISQLPS